MTADKIIEITAVPIQDFESPDVQVRRRAFRILADNYRRLREGHKCPKLEAVLQRLEENQPQL
jgi:hypothetical protein